MLVDRLIGLSSPTAALRRAIWLIDQNKQTDAMPLLARAAKAGLPEAEFRIAKAYLEGAGVPASQIECLRWLQLASEHGYVEAQALLAALHLRGASASVASRLFGQEAAAEPDYPSALKWARAAAEFGLARRSSLARLHPRLWARRDARPRCGASVV